MSLKSEYALKKEIKQLKKALDQEQSKSAFLKLEMRKRTASFMTQMQIFEGIFKTALNEAGTIGEAKRWYSEWAKDVNAIDIEADNTEQKIAQVIDKHGFEFEVKDHYEDVDNMWEKSRNTRKAKCLHMPLS